MHSDKMLLSIAIIHNNRVCILSRNAEAVSPEYDYFFDYSVTYSEVSQYNEIVEVSQYNGIVTQYNRIVPSVVPYSDKYEDINNYVERIVFDLRCMGSDITTHQFYDILRRVKFPCEGYNMFNNDSDDTNVIDLSYDAEYQQRQQDAILNELSQVERVLNDDIDEMVDDMFNDSGNESAGNESAGNASVPILPPRIVPQVVYRTIPQVAPQPVMQSAPKRYTQHIGLSTLVDMYEAMKERLEGLEDCPICATPITKENASMTVCTHIFCNTCISKIDKCSICRESLLL
jgi:hypothetical protein